MPSRRYRATIDAVVAHVAEKRAAQVAIEEPVLLWRGNTMMASESSTPIAAALIGAALWRKDHVKR